jgi:hypothetical protein
MRDADAIRLPPVSGERMATSDTATATITLRVVGHALPGADAANRPTLHVGVQRGSETIDLVPATAGTAVFTCPLQVVPGAGSRFDVRGPFVHGKPGARFIYLVWGDLAADGAFVMTQRLKIGLSNLDASLIAAAQAPNAVLEASLALTDARGRPRAATVPPDAIAWSVH